MKPSEALAKYLTARDILQVRMEEHPRLRQDNVRLTEARQVVADAAAQFDRSIHAAAGGSSILDIFADGGPLDGLVKVGG